jgi:hypothetical protein
MRVFCIPSWPLIKSTFAFTLGSIATTIPAGIMSASSTSLGIFAGSDMKGFVDIIKKTNILDGKIVDIAIPILSPVAIGLLVRVYSYAAGLYTFSNQTTNLTEKVFTKTSPYIGETHKKILKTLIISSAFFSYTYTLYNLKDYSISKDNPDISDRLPLTIGSITGFLSMMKLLTKIYSKN